MNSRPIFRRLCSTLLGLAALASVASAQINLDRSLPIPGQAPRQGLLGASYLALDYSYVDDRNGPGTTQGPSLALNLAASDNVDLTTSLAFVRQKQWPDTGNVFSFGIDSTIYTQLRGVKPFLVCGIGYQWSGAPLGGNLSLWNAGVGVEVPVAPHTAVTARVISAGSFQDGINPAWQYSAGVNHWLTHRVALNASVTFLENQAIGYALGARWAF